MNFPHDDCSSNDTHDLNVQSSLTPETGSLPAPCNDLSITLGTSDLRWYVVQSKPREEERAFHYLKEKGFDTYLPRMEVVSVRKFKNAKTKKPLFPGYLFCRFKKEDEILAHVRWTKGVKNILPESVSPSPVDDEIVAAIHSLEQEDGVIRKKPLQKNDRIRVARGPMQDVLGVFDHWSSDSGRVMVLLNFINYQASVELHHSLIEKVA
jgi:transcriptional antiterminator RfaH